MENQSYYNYLESGTSFLEDLTNDEIENRNSYFMSSGQENQLYTNNAINQQMYSNSHLPQQAQPMQSHHVYYGNNNPQAVSQQMSKPNQPIYRPNSNPMVASDPQPSTNYSQHYSHPNSDLYRMPLREPGMYPNNSGYYDQQSRLQASHNYQTMPNSTTQHPSPSYPMQQVPNNATMPSQYHMPPQQQSSAMPPQQHANYLQQQQQHNQNQYHSLGAAQATVDSYNRSNSGHHQMHPNPQTQQQMVRPYSSTTPNQHITQSYCQPHPAQSMIQSSQQAMKQPRNYPPQSINRPNQIPDMDIYGNKIRLLEERLHHLYQTRGQSPGVQQEMLDIQEQIRSLKASREKEILLKQRHRMPTDASHLNQPMTSPNVPVSISPKSTNQYHPTPSPIIDMQNNQSFNNSASSHLQSPLHHLTQMTMNPVSLASNDYSYPNIPPSTSTRHYTNSQVEHAGSGNSSVSFSSLHGKPYSANMPSSNNQNQYQQQQQMNNSLTQPSSQINNYNYSTSESSALPNMAELASPLLSGNNSRMENLQKQKLDQYNHDPYSADLIRQDELLTPPNLDIRMSSIALNTENHRHNDFNSPGMLNVSNPDNKTIPNSTALQSSSHQYSGNYASQSYSSSQAQSHKNPSHSHSSRTPRSHRADPNHPKLPMNSLDKIIDQVVGRSDKHTISDQNFSNANYMAAQDSLMHQSQCIEGIPETLIDHSVFVPHSESYSTDFPDLNESHDIDIPELSFESSIPDSDQKTTLQINCDASEDLPSVLVTPPALEPQINLDYNSDANNPSMFLDPIDQEVVDVINMLVDKVADYNGNNNSILMYDSPLLVNDVQQCEQLESVVSRESDLCEQNSPAPSPSNECLNLNSEIADLNEDEEPNKDDVVLENEPSNELISHFPSADEISTKHSDCSDVDNTGDSSPKPDLLNEESINSDISDHEEQSQRCKTPLKDDSNVLNMENSLESSSQPLTITVPGKSSSECRVSSTPHSSPAPPPLEVESAYSSTDSVALASTGGNDQVCFSSSVTCKTDMAIPVLDPPYQSIGVFSPDLTSNDKVEQNELTPQERTASPEVTKNVVPFSSPPQLQTSERHCSLESKDVANEPPRLEEQLLHDDIKISQSTVCHENVESLSEPIKEDDPPRDTSEPSLMISQDEDTPHKDDSETQDKSDDFEHNAPIDSDLSVQQKRSPGRKRKKLSIAASNDLTCNSNEPMKKRKIALKDSSGSMTDDMMALSSDKFDGLISEVSRDSENIEIQPEKKRRVGRPPKLKSTGKSNDSCLISPLDHDREAAAVVSNDESATPKSHSKKIETPHSISSSVSGRKRGRPTSNRQRKQSDSDESSLEDQVSKSPAARASKTRPERFKTTRKLEKNQYFESEGEEDSRKSKPEELPESESEQDESETKIVEKILCWRTLKLKPNEDNSTEESSITNADEPVNNKTDEKESPFEEEYYVKYKGYSYLHCEWKTLSEITDPRISTKVKRFKQKDPKDKSLEDDDDDLFNPDYVEVDRVLDMRTTRSDHDDTVDNEDSEKIVEYLVKWKSMAYEDATWELAENVDPNKVKEFLNWRDPPSNIDELRRSKRPNSKQWKKIETVTPYKNGNVLRDYQLEGVNWLTFCWYQHRNCILADEMGLGKTVQSISFIIEIFKHNIIGPFLVIVPLSTVGNWQREFENWSDLNVIVYHGSAASRKIIQKYEVYYKNENNRKPKRGRAPSLMNKVYKFHVMITTYEMLMSDLDFFVKIHWRIAIIDEAHRLKNKKCKLGEGLRDLKLDHRILLTGTPLQNNVEELFSLLNFLEPEAFPSAEIFLEQYGNLKSEEQVESLKALLKPMMLRRLKDDVEKSIAPKEETIIEVELTNMQKKYYRAILERNFAFLSKGTSSASNVPNLMNTMMELRKCCNHPFLIKGAEDHILSDMRIESEGQGRPVDEDDLQFRALVYASGKLVLIHKLLPKLKSGGHKVLIFSQMVKVLDILEDYLIHQKYLYERIDGGIHGLIRQEAIDRFSNDPDKFVFLLCTKAGGIGINLTAADVVIIYDSDWNPQNDLQAQARCHRIGQQKMVNVYRLITRNSYEREMFDRASLKLGLDKAVLHSTVSASKDTKQPQLSKAEIEELLKKGAYGALMEDDKAGEEFCEEDIDKILQSRSHVVKLDTGEANSTFSKASFTTQDTRTDIDIDDPNFWQKWAKKAGVNEDAMENSSLIMEEPRQRRQTNRYNAADAGAHISELEESAGPDESAEEELLSGLGSSLDRSSRKGKRGKKMGRRSKDSDPIDRADLFRVEKLLLCWGWGRWEESLTHSTFKKSLTASQLEVLARAILTLSLHFYNGDPRIKSFIGDLLRPESEAVDIRRHSGLSTPVCRGRGYRRMGGHAFGGTTNNSESPNEAENSPNGSKSITRSFISDSLSESQSKELDFIDPENVLLCDSFKKHVQRASNKLLHRIQMLYFLEHEVLLPWQAAVPNIPPLRPPRPGSIDFAELLPTSWWDSEADMSLLKGVYKHGFENYTAIRADPELCFLNRCGPPQEELEEEDPEKTLQAICEDDIPSTDSKKIEQKSDSGLATLPFDSSPASPNKNSAAEEIKATEEGAPPSNLLTFPSSCELNGRFRKLIAYFQRIRHQERFESARRKRVSSDTDNDDSLANALTNKWSRREEAEFYRIVSSFGVEYDSLARRYNWKRFRQLGNLTKKSDQSLSDYYEAFMKMCRACSIAATELSVSGQPDLSQITILPISEERASRCLSKIALLSRIRNQVLPHPELDERLKLLTKSSDLPEWWLPGVHDKELLVGAAKHGIARMDFTILRDKDLAFYHLADALQKRLTDETTHGDDHTGEVKLESKCESESVPQKAELDNYKSVNEAVSDDKTTMSDHHQDIPKTSSPILKDETEDNSQSLPMHSTPESVKKTAEEEDSDIPNEDKSVNSDAKHHQEVELSSDSPPISSTGNIEAIKCDDTSTKESLDNNKSEKGPVECFEMAAAFTWPKDRVLLHRLDVICKYVETGDASANEMLPSQTVTNQGSADSNGSTLASTYDALLAAASSSRSSSPGSISNNQPPLSTPKPSNQSSSTGCRLPGLESTLARAATLGFSPSKMSSARCLPSSGSSRGRGRGRKRVTDSRTNLPPISGSTAHPNVNSMMDSQTAALHQLMYASAGLDMTSPMGQELIKHLIASSGLDPALNQQLVANLSSSMLASSVEEAATSSKTFKHRKRKLESVQQAESADSKLLKRGIGDKDSKEDLPGKLLTPSINSATDGGINAAMSSLLCGMGSASHLAAAAVPVTGGSSSASVLNSLAALSEEAAEVQVPLINLRDGTLVYGDDAPKRKNLAKFLQENPDYMPYSVEKEDQVIFTTIAKSRGQDTSPMDALVYNHYLTVLQTSAAAAAVSPYSSAAMNPTAALLGMNAGPASHPTSSGIADYYSAAYAAAASIPGFPPDALAAYAAALASASGSASDSAASLTNGIPGVVPPTSRSETDSEIMRTVLTKTPENKRCKEKPSRPSSSHAPPALPKVSRHQSRSSTPKHAELGASGLRLSSSVTPIDSSASSAIINNLPVTSNYMSSAGHTNFTTKQSSLEEQQQAAMLSYAAMYNPGFLYQQMLSAGAQQPPGSFDYSSYLAAAFASQQAQALAAASNNGLYSGAGATAGGDEFLASLMAASHQAVSSDEKTRFSGHKSYCSNSSVPISKESTKPTSTSKLIPTTSPAPSTLLSGMNVNFPSMEAGSSSSLFSGSSSSNVDSMTAAALQNDALMKSYMTAYLQQQQQLMQFPPQATRNLIGADAYDLGMLASSSILPPASSGVPSDPFLSASKPDSQFTAASELPSELRTYRSENDDSALDLSKK